MIKKEILLFCILTLLLSTQPHVTANFSPNNVLSPVITITKDGNVVPETAAINRTGRVYTLNGDLVNYSMIIQCSDIIFDGKGYSIRSNLVPPKEPAGPGLVLERVSNVTVLNIGLLGFNMWVRSLILRDCSKCNLTGVNMTSTTIERGDTNIIGQSKITVSTTLESSPDNHLTQNILGKLLMFYSDDNLISKNNITGIHLEDSRDNRIHYNNFLFTSPSSFYYKSEELNYWDNGTVGNYWANYLTKYPNASEIDNSGIGDTPYQVEQDRIFGDGGVVDYYPLMHPIIPILLSHTSTPSSTSSNQILSQESILAFTAFAIIAVAVVTSLLIYKRRKSQSPYS
jgi:parallel beta-helix repeat protein